MVKKTAKYLYYFIHILLIGILIILCFSSVYYRDKIYSRLLPALIIFSVINIILIFLSKNNNRKKYFLHICREIIEFLILNTVLALIISVIIWIKRDKPLIDIANVLEYTFPSVFLNIFFTVLLISYIIILLGNIKKSFQIDKNIFILFSPVKLFVLFALYIVVWFAWDTVCPWDPLIDTEYSDTFNIYNIDKIKEGMTKENVIELIGDPLFVRINEEGTGKLEFTSDGKYQRTMEKNNYGDFAWYSIGGGYAWFNYDLEFKDEKLIKIESFWAHD